MNSTPSSPSPRGEPNSKVALILSLAFILVGVWLRAEYVDFQGLSIDELYTLEQVESPLGTIVAQAVQDVHPPFFYIAARLCYLAQGKDPLAVRWFSWGMASLTLLLFLFLARRIGGARFGLLATALLALSPLHFYFSTDGRNYALGTLLLTIQLTGAWYLMAPAATKREIRWATCAYFLAGLAACYTHLLLVFVLFFQGMGMIGLLGAHRRWRRFRRALLLHVALFVLFLPWLFISFYQAGRMGDALKWMPHPTPDALWTAYSTNLPLGAFYSVRTRFDASTLAGAGDSPAFMWLGGALNPLFLALVAAIGLGAAWHLRQRPCNLWSVEAHDHNALKDFLLLLLLLTIGPLLLAYLVSAYYVRVFFPPRFALFHLPHFILLLCAGLIGMRPERNSPQRLIGTWGRGMARRVAVASGWLVAALWLAAEVQLLGAYHLRPPFRETPQAIKAARAAIRPGETLAYTTNSAWGIKEVEFHAGEILPDHETVWLPDLLDEAAGLPPRSWKTPGVEAGRPEMAGPDRIIVLDWSAGEDENSGKRGTQALHQLRRHAGKIVTLYDPLMDPRHLAVELFTEINWGALAAERRAIRAAFAPLQELLWHDLRDAGGPELLEYNGFTAPDFTPEGLRRWLHGGASNLFYDWYAGELPPGDHWIVACFWQSPATAGRSLEIETQIRNTETPQGWYRAELVPGYNIVAVPFTVFADEYDVGVELSWRYDTWGPAETPGGEPDARALGPWLVWFGTLSPSLAGDDSLDGEELRVMLQPSGENVIIAKRTE